MQETEEIVRAATCDVKLGLHTPTFSEFKHGVYRRQQTAKMISEFVSFSSNP